MTTTRNTVSSPHPDDYKKALMTAEEYEKFVEYYFVVDEDSGEIVADRPTPYQVAGVRELQSYDEDDLEEDLDPSMLKIPRSFFDKGDKAHGFSR